MDEKEMLKQIENSNIPKEQRDELLKLIKGNFTIREEANALTAECFRNSFLEDLHAGEDSEILTDEKYSRITQEEMKKLMIETSAKLCELLEMKENEPAKYKHTLRQIHLFYSKDWDTRLKEYKMKKE